MWELDHKEGWVPKNWCFWTVVLEKTLESPLDCKEIQPVNPKGNPLWIFTEGLMLKLQYFGHLMRRDKSLEKPLMLGKIEAGGEEGKREWDGWMLSLTQWIWVWANPGKWWRTGKPGVLQPMVLQTLRQDLATEKQTIEETTYLNYLNYKWNILKSTFQYVQQKTILRLKKKDGEEREIRSLGLTYSHDYK